MKIVNREKSIILFQLLQLAVQQMTYDVLQYGHDVSVLYRKSSCSIIA